MEQRVGCLEKLLGESAGKHGAAARTMRYVNSHPEEFHWVRKHPIRQPGKKLPATR